MSTLDRKRPMISLTLVIPVVGALLLQACGSKAAPVPAVADGAAAGELVDLAPCVYKPDRTEYAADCGTLIVPENRSDAQSRLVAVPIIRVRALSQNPVEPIFFLQGGPGGSNLEFRHLDGLIENRDLVQVGYRGVDGSVVLDCPEIADAVRSSPADDMLSDAAIKNYSDASRQCAARLEREGVDLAGYTMTEVIDDVEAAREALGYDRIDLLGESYGTRLEMIYEWMYPERLARVIMVDVNPPGHFLWEAPSVEAQLKDYADLCAKDARCGARTKDLLASMRQVSENMPSRWFFLPIDTNGVKMVTFFGLMETITPPGMPVPLSGPGVIDMWLAAERGDYSGMALATLLRNSFIPNLFVHGDLLSKAASGGDFVGRTPSRVEFSPQSSIIGSQLSLWHAAMAPGWPYRLVPEQYRTVQATSVETLLVSGSMDFSCPPQFATNELLPYLKNGEQVVLKDFGHTEAFWYQQGEARTHLLNTFLDMGAVDDSLYVYEPVNFDVGLGWPGMAKALLAIVVVVLAGMALLIWTIVRRFRSRRAS
jgi:pimeloyl-ACP methyl ester carboxylesterase